jgi:hypothetical protein
MIPDLAVPEVGSQVIEQALTTPATETYAAFIWLVHCVRFPEDIGATYRGAGFDEATAEAEMCAWRDASDEHLRSELNGRLIQTVKMAKHEVVEVPDDYETALAEDKVGDMQDYLKLVGTVAMGLVRNRESDWSAKNPAIYKLINPIANRPGLRQAWQYSDRKQPTRPLRMPLYALVRGYQLR